MRVFVSYSHQDEAWKDRVVRQLGVLAGEGLEVWDDRQPPRRRSGTGSGSRWPWALPSPYTWRPTDMNVTQEDILTRARDWRAAGKGVALATVVRTWGSSPPADIMRMGVGGLIESAAETGDEGEGDEPQRGARAARVAAVVLAAGRSSRMGERNKLLCAVQGIPMVRHAVNAALGSHCVQTLVVTGHDAAAVEAALAACPVSLVHNADHAQGIAASLRCGLRALPQDIDGAMVVLADMPRLTAAHLDRLLAAFDPAAPAIVVPERDGRRGNPVLWPRRYFVEMLTLAGDQGARGLIERHAANVVRVAFDDDAIFADIDTPGELASLAAAAS